MTTWGGLETFAGDAEELPEHLDALAVGDVDAAWAALDILRDIAVPSRARTDGPYCSAAPAIVRELLDVARSLDDELRAAVLRLTADILAADHRDLFGSAPDVPAALALLHRTGAGADVAATVADRIDDIGAHLTSSHAPTRAGAWFLLGLLPSRPIPAAPLDADEGVRNLRSFLAGMWRQPDAAEDFAWLGSLSGPHALPEPTTSVSVLGLRLSPKLFPLFDGNAGDLAAARAKALGEEQGSPVADALLRAWEAGASHLAEAAARACLRVRVGMVRPDVLSPRERRVVERATAEGLRLAALASAGVPMEPAERAAWLGIVGERVVDRPTPQGLGNIREHEPLGAWLARMEAAGSSEEAAAALQATCSPAECLDVLRARIQGAYGLQAPRAEEVLDAIERAGVDGITVARSILAADRLRRAPDGHFELGWGLGAPGNAALLALARLEKWSEIPEEYVAFVSFDGPPSWFSELMAKLRQVDRARVAAAGATRMPTTRLRRADYESLARLLAEGRSAEVTAIFVDRARAASRGETVLAELRAVSQELGLGVPGL